MLTDNLAFELGENTSLGVQIAEIVGGLLQGDDVVVINGSYTEAIFLESKDPPITINVNVTGVTGSTPTPTPTDYSLDNDSAIGNQFFLGN